MPLKRRKLDASFRLSPTTGVLTPSPTPAPTPTPVAPLPILPHWTWLLLAVAVGWIGGMSFILVALFIPII